MSERWSFRAPDQWSKVGSIISLRSTIAELVIETDVVSEPLLQSRRLLSNRTRKMASRIAKRREQGGQNAPAESQAEGGNDNGAQVENAEQ